MTSTEQERWARVKERLRAEVGEDIYSSWFARMELEGIEEDTVKLSVPTRFLKSWIQSHYAEKRARLLAGGATEHPAHRAHGALGRHSHPAAQAQAGGDSQRARRPSDATARDSRATAASRAARWRRSRPCTRRSAARRSIRA